MMRAGKLDKTIVVQRFTSTVDEMGTPIETWADLATVRAQLVQATTEEFMRGWGQEAQAAVVFRIRHMDGLSTADRVSLGGTTFDIKEIRELGRREGLDLRCTASVA